MAIPSLLLYILRRITILSECHKLDIVDRFAIPSGRPHTTNLSTATTIHYLQHHSSWNSLCPTCHALGSPVPFGVSANGQSTAIQLEPTMTLKSTAIQLEPTMTLKSTAIQLEPTMTLKSTAIQLEPTMTLKVIIYTLL
jgi:hypothetical protein